MSTEEEYVTLYRRFPRGVLVRKTTTYPSEWTRREVNKSVEGFVVGYARSLFRPLLVRRTGAVTPIGSEPEWWEVVTS